MKKNLTIGLFVGALAMLLLSGCYTQLQSYRDRDDDDDNYASSNQQQYTSDTTYNGGDDGQTIVNNYYDDNWHHPYGFDYYYPRYSSTIWPSTYFTASYYDPYYGFGLGYSYGCYPSYYSYYPGFYSYYPYYGYGYGYGYGYYGGGYVYNRANTHTGRRSFGSTRGETVSGSGGGYMGGSNYGGTGSSINMPTASQRGGGTVSGSPASSSSGNRGRGNYRPSPNATPRYTPHSGRGGYVPRQSVGERPSYSPPPPSNPRPSSSAPAPAAAPSSGGSSGRSGSGRSGGHR